MLIVHSYGRMAITGTADRAADRVAHRVYFDAAYPRDDESLHDHAFEMIDATRRGLYVENGVELVMKPTYVSNLEGRIDGRWPCSPLADGCAYSPVSRPDTGVPG
jgi:pimeloyl-ACP methyl ester carboxylesterase